MLDNRVSFGALLDADKNVFQPSDGQSVTRRILWIQNKPNRYFVQMLDALNSHGDIEYFGVFLCPPPAGNPLYQIPIISPHIFLGNTSQNAGPDGYKRIGAKARAYIKTLAFSGVIIGGYDSRFKRWILRYCHDRGIPAALFTDSNIRAERGKKMGRRFKRFIKRAYLQRIIRCADAIICCNRSGVAYWRYYGCPGGKLVRSTAFCGADPTAALLVNLADILARFHLESHTKLIFTAARLASVKTLHLMVTAFTQSGLADQGWVWVVAGGGPLRRELEQQAGLLNGNAIRFLGPLAAEDITLLMAQSELFVLPSTYEPHGIVVTEAMAAGTPVIASNNCGAARELVRNGKTGWLFAAGDSGDLLRVLRIATADEGKRLKAMERSCIVEFNRWYARHSPTRKIPELCRVWALQARTGPRDNVL
jgi:glycosyltransferase involved in cell wall biosynthesis